MFRLLKRFWLGNATLEYALQHLRFAPVGPVAGVALPSLPDQFSAVKFYAGTAIRDTPEHRRLLRTLVERLACRGPVILLDTGLRLDEHEDFLFGGIPNVTSLDRAMSPQMNLAVQTEVIRRSSLFVGTAGSLAWLAPMLGVDTVALHADDRFLGPHLYAAPVRLRVDAVGALHVARFERGRPPGSGSSARCSKLTTSVAAPPAGRPFPVCFPASAGLLGPAA